MFNRLIGVVTIDDIHQEASISPGFAPLDG
jgi:hypothetical protein